MSWFLAHDVQGKMTFHDIPLFFILYFSCNVDSDNSPRYWFSLLLETIKNNQIWICISQSIDVFQHRPQLIFSLLRGSRKMLLKLLRESVWAVFRSQSNIYDGAFWWKYVAVKKPWLFSQKNIVDVRLDSKYAPAKSPIFYSLSWILQIASSVNLKSFPEKYIF